MIRKETLMRARLVGCILVLGTSGAAVGAQSEAPAASLIVVSDRPERQSGGQEFIHAVLVLSPGKSARSAGAKLLAAPPVLDVWFRGQDAGCETPPDARQREWRADATSAEGPKALPVCAEAEGDASFRLVATIRFTATDGGAIEHVVSSDAVKPAPPWWRDPLWTGLAGGLLGFLSGFVAKLLERWIEQLTARRKLKDEMTKLITETLYREEQSNRQLLSDYLEGRLAEAPSLQVAGYQRAVEGRALEYLAKGDRARYVKRVESLYREHIRNYNTDVDLKKSDAHLKVRAKAVLEAYEQR
jgi:hypothetical protein